jgi:hypothetical protein
MRLRYRILPGYYCRYELQRRVFFVFWKMESLSDDFDELAETVRMVGGTLD